MKRIAVIPARMGSSRFPGKPMEKIMGMPMVGHCYHRAMLAEGISDVYVATCDQVIFDYIKSIDGKAVMTSDKHTRASTRTAEALEKIEYDSGEKIDIIVMVQGDEPIIPPQSISMTLKHFSDSDVQIVNVISKLETMKAFKDKNNVKVVIDNNNNALYFSREPIPSPWQGWKNIPRYMQTGIIAFRREMLYRFNAMQETPLEQIESVDMNRVLELGGEIKMVLTDSITLGVDTPEELFQAEKLLMKDMFVKDYLY